ncbi:MAG: S8 family serine peptidase [Clostridiales Family XIII bacterium]|jgi:hypothetical protein|nr:S8 family serine peptidase [Clostridiales Family XIII bacterium]
MEKENQNKDKLLKFMKSKKLLAAMIALSVVVAFYAVGRPPDSGVTVIKSPNVPLSDGSDGSGGISGLEEVGLDEENLESLVVETEISAGSFGYIVKMKDEAVDEDMIEASPESEVIADSYFAVDELNDIPGFVATADDIEYILPDNEVSFNNLEEDGVPNDPDYVTTAGSSYEFTQMTLHTMNPEGAWKRNYFGQGVRVAVIDTGLNPDSDMKVSNILQGYSFVSGADPADTSDKHGHGTEVVKRLFTQTNNGIGKAGPTDSIELLPIKVSNGSGFSTSTLYKAIDYAIDAGADVINLSCGSAAVSSQEAEIYRAFSEKGVILVAAAGNENRSTLCAPAAYDSVIGVGAVGFSDKKRWVKSGTEGSNFGNGLDAVVSFSPTSQATPFATGLAVIAKQYDPDATVQTMRSLLEKSSEDLGTTGWDTEYGYGLIDYGNFVSFMETGKPEVKQVLKPKVTPAAVKAFKKAPAPKITGTVKVGKKLTAKVGTWSPKPKFAYQWYANGKKIAKATKSTYKLTKASKGKKITVKVTAKKANYKATTKTSKATAKVKK